MLEGGKYRTGRGEKRKCKIRISRKISVVKSTSYKLEALTIASEQYASTGYPETLSIYLSTLFTLLFTITHFPLHTPMKAVKLTVGETCP